MPHQVQTLGGGYLRGSEMQSPALDEGGKWIGHRFKDAIAHIAHNKADEKQDGENPRSDETVLAFGTPTECLGHEWVQPPNIKSLHASRPF